MSINWLVIPTLGIALILAWVGYRIADRARTPRRGLLVLAMAMITAIPAVTYAVYYLHILDNAAWFYSARALPGAELAAGGAGFIAGILVKWLRFQSPVLRLLPIAILGILCLGIVLPHLKPVLAPLDRRQLHDHWQDGVCFQSTASTCGPASTATVLAAHGIAERESVLAEECLSSQGGTECWYLVRALRRRGLQAGFRTRSGIDATLRLPAIAGVMAGGSGHFIAIIARDGDSLVIGDPLSGRERVPVAEVARLRLTGFFIETWR